MQYVPKDSYFSRSQDKTLLAKAKEAIAREEAGGSAGGSGMGIGSGKGGGVGGSRFPKAFWKSSQDLNEDKVRILGSLGPLNGLCCGGLLGGLLDLALVWSVVMVCWVAYWMGSVVVVCWMAYRMGSVVVIFLIVRWVTCYTDWLVGWSAVRVCLFDGPSCVLVVFSMVCFDWSKQSSGNTIALRLTHGKVRKLSKFDVNKVAHMSSPKVGVFIRAS